MGVQRSSTCPGDSQPELSGEYLIWAKDMTNKEDWAKFKVVVVVVGVRW